MKKLVLLDRIKLVQHNPAMNYSLTDAAKPQSSINIRGKCINKFIHVVSARKLSVQLLIVQPVMQDIHYSPSVAPLIWSHPIYLEPARLISFPPRVQQYEERVCIDEKLFIGSHLWKIIIIIKKNVKHELERRKFVHQQQVQLTGSTV